MRPGGLAKRRWPVVNCKGVGAAWRADPAAPLRRESFCLLLAFTSRVAGKVWPVDCMLRAVLTVPQVVLHEGQILEKPEDEAEVGMR